MLIVPFLDQPRLYQKDLEPALSSLVDFNAEPGILGPVHLDDIPQNGQMLVSSGSDSTEAAGYETKMRGITRCISALIHIYIYREIYLSIYVFIYLFV